MNDNDWLILKVLSETGTLTKASNLLFISQPALTYRLHCIEKEFNIKIFERHPKGISITPQGELLIQYAKDMLINLQQLKHSLHKSNIPLEGNLRLGISTIFAKTKLAPLLTQYKKLYPHVKLFLKTGSSVSLLPGLLETNQIDIAIMRNDNFQWDETFFTISEEPWYLIYSHPIEFNKLVNIPFILNETAVKTKSYDIFLRWWSEIFSLPMPTPIWVNTIDAVIQFVNSNLGWSIVPKTYLPKHIHLYSLPLYMNKKLLLHKTVMAYRTQSINFPAVAAFVELIKKHFLHKKDISQEV